MAGIISNVFPMVTEILQDVMGDEGIAETITYKKYTGQGFSDELGYVASTYDESSLTALRLQHNAKSVELIQAPVQIGDVVFIIIGEDCPSGMSLKDIIVDSTSVSMKVADVKEIFGLAKIVSVESGGVQS